MKKVMSKSERIRNVKRALWFAQASIPRFVSQETGMAAYDAVKAIIPALLVSLALVTLTTLVGAGVGIGLGSLGAGVGAIPLGVAGGSVGFKAGLWILNIVGLAFLVEYMGSSLWDAVRYIERGILRAWGPKDEYHRIAPYDGDVMKAGDEIALGVAIVVRCILEGIVLYLTVKGISKLPELIANLKRSKFGETFAIWVEKNHQQMLSNPKLTKRVGTGAAAEKPARVLTDHTTVQEQPRLGQNNSLNNRKLPDGMKNTDNKSIREWYNQQTNPEKLKRLDEQWKKEGVPIEERAERIYKIRHDARLAAREYMQNAEEVAALRSRDLATYGSSDGPTFLQEVHKYQNQGLVGNDAYQAVINGASRTNPAFNTKFGIVR